MKRFLLLSFILISLKIFSQTNTNVNLKFDIDTADFGNVSEGDTVRFDFWFTNNGTENLIIKQAYPACGCTKPTYTEGEIKPGERGFVRVEFKSEGFGNQQILKEVIIINNGPERYARFKATVISTKVKGEIVKAEDIHHKKINENTKKKKKGKKKKK